MSDHGHKSAAQHEAHVIIARDALAEVAHDHGDELQSFFAVVLCKDGAFPVGLCNAAGAGEALGVMLETLSKLPISNKCVACDRAVIVAQETLEFFRRAMARHNGRFGERGGC